MTKRDGLHIALPKGRLGDKVYNLLEKAGYECPEIKEDNRKLVHRNELKNISYLSVKPSDVAIYVEKGVADIGVVGKDTLLESTPLIYELMDLGFGKCRIAIAAPVGFIEDYERPLRVATKYANVAKQYYTRINREVEIIKLNGSIELAPILGLSDVIVDIVETGSTLRENNLEVISEIEPYISARLIANRANFNFKHKEIEKMIKAISEIL